MARIKQKINLEQYRTKDQMDPDEYCIPLDSFMGLPQDYNSVKRTSSLADMRACPLLLDPEHLTPVYESQTDYLPRLAN